MKPEEIEKALPMSVYIVLGNREYDTNAAIRKVEPYDYYKLNGYARTKKEKIALIFGSLIILTVFTSFIALIVMTVLF